MIEYFIKRILSLIPVLFVVSIAVFLLIHITPGSPATAILGQEATIEQIAELEVQLGLNDPIHQQYISWIGKALKGDFGKSYFLQEPVLQVIIRHLPPSLSVAVLALSVSLLIAIPIGITAARKQGTSTDQVIMSISLLGMAVPSFLLALLFVLFVGLYLGLLPVSGYSTLSSGIWNYLSHLILPAVSLGTVHAAIIARMTRTSMLENLNSNFIKTARAKGVKERDIVYKHALRNAALPILTVVGLTLGSLIVGTVATESVFNIPGIGQLIIRSIQRRDFPVIQGLLLLTALVYVIINLIIDLLYGIIDPRVRLERK